ncbi:DUF2339 domain-containing protein [Amycolatopsis sp. NPDC059027]|uniref:DUF2339 domain-containing protein n=1 Tax=Amycolatopsis sp. NPDC059027 TaxID=3346709 RepID=UPI00366DA9BF
MTTDRDRILGLAGEIDDLGRRLAAVGAELRAFQATRTEEPAPHQAPAPPPVAATPPMPPPPMYWPPQPTPPQPAYRPVPRPTFMETLGKQGAGSKIVAWVGGAVTLLGIVLLLVLAVQRGWLGPLPRVLAGGAFGLALVGTGLWLHRKPVGRTGAFALVGTGIATLYLDAIAATVLYDFLPSIAGLALGLLVTVGGVLVAVRWNSALLATAVVLGCAVCAPMITRGFTPELVLFLLVVQASTAPVQLRREWPSLTMSAAFPPIIASVVSTALIGSPGSWTNTGAALGVAAVGLVLALIVLQRKENDPGSLAMLATSAAPALIAALLLPKTGAVIVSGGIALALLGIWAARRWWPGYVGDLAGMAGLIALMQATMTQFDGTARAAALLGEALLLVFLARWSRNRFAMAASAGFAVVGGLVGIVHDYSPALLMLFRTRTTGELVGALVVAVLLLAVSILLPWTAFRLEVLRAPAANLPPWLLAGVVALYGAAGVVLCATLLALPGRTGFLTGHVLITVSWTVAALVLLVRGINVVALRVIGLVLVGAAVLKLVLFDLAALDGMARVAAFLGAGLALLVAGVRYARVVRES